MTRKENMPRDRNRVEFIADPEWVSKVGAHADALGVSLSAYIRMAVNHQMINEPIITPEEIAKKANRSY